VAAIETGDGKRLNEDLVKAITGGDSLRCRFLYRESFEYVPQFKLWLATNNKPQIWGTDHAIWRRIVLVPFTETIPPDRIDAELADKLRREFLGVLAWMVEGFREYTRIGLNPPKSVTTATDQYRNDEDVIGQFLDECCYQRKHETVGATDLFQRFEDWGGTLTQTMFGRKISERGYARKTVGGRKAYEGIRMK